MLYPKLPLKTSLSSRRGLTPCSRFSSLQSRKGETKESKYRTQPCSTRNCLSSCLHALASQVRGAERVSPRNKISNTTLLSPKPPLELSACSRPGSTPCSRYSSLQSRKGDPIIPISITTLLSPKPPLELSACSRYSSLQSRKGEPKNPISITTLLNPRVRPNLTCSAT